MGYRDGGAAKPFVVVLTGGPCAGKSSAMALVRDRLNKRGFQVLTVPENATHFLQNSDGFQPEWAGSDAQVAMQRIFLDYQISQEQAFKAFGNLHPTKPAVLLLDCCTLNGKIYVSDEQWGRVLTSGGGPPLTEEELFARYDMIIHMKTCAGKGQYEWGLGSNNPGRYHTPEQAVECDERSLKVFAPHKHVCVVPHCASFDDKIQAVLRLLVDALHVEGLAGRRCRKRVCIKNPEGLLAMLDQPTTRSFRVTCTFMDEQMQHSVRMRAKVPNRLWWEKFQKLQLSELAESIATWSGPAVIGEDARDVMFERRDHVEPRGDACKGYLKRKVIKEDDYFEAVNSARSTICTTKFVLTFVINSQYYELFFFPSYREPVLDLSEEPLTFPRWLEPVDEQDVPRAIPTPAKRRRVLQRFTTEEAASHSPVKS